MIVLQESSMNVRTNVRMQRDLESKDQYSLGMDSDFYCGALFTKYNINNIYRNYLKYKKRRDKTIDPKSISEEKVKKEQPYALTMNACLLS